MKSILTNKIYTLIRSYSIWNYQKNTLFISFYSLENSDLLTLCESSPLPFFKISEHNILYTNPFEFFDIIFYCCYHTSNLSIFSFTKCNREFWWWQSSNLTRLCSIFASYYCILPFYTSDDTSSGSIILEFDTYSFSHLIECFIFHLSIHFYHILFLVFIARMHEIIRESTIIGKNDESCCFFIQSTNWEYSLRYINNIHDSLFIIFTRETSCYNITRFIENIIHEIFLVFNDLVREFYYINIRINNLSNMSYNTVDRNEWLFDIFFCLSTRADSSMCKVFLEFHGIILWIRIIGKKIEKAKNFWHERRILYILFSLIFYPLCRNEYSCRTRMMGKYKT